METVVIHENDKDILEILYAALELEGFRVYALPDCDADFMEVIDKARPHVVILDYRLSDDDCQKLCREIKLRFQYLPVVAMSCNSNINEVYNRLGFDDYIPKPFDLDHLYQVLRKYAPQNASR